ncbi:MAG: FtsQ-type POTRA domain-containing protein [Oscillospiraceae bacterium]
MPTQKKKQKKQKQGGGVILSSVSFIVICAALIFGMSVFFRVSEIKVNGADRYTREDVISASGVKEGDNLVFINRDAIANKISTKLMYAGDVTVSRKLPNTVIIDVAESSTIASIPTDSGPWLINKNCKLLEKSKVADTSPRIVVKGFTAIKPQAGKTVSVKDEDKIKVTYLSELLSAMERENMIAEVSVIDMSNLANAEFTYQEKFKVKLGKKENLEYKLSLLLAAIKKLGPEETGTFDLSENKEAHFSLD